MARHSDESRRFSGRNAHPEGMGKKRRGRAATRVAPTWMPPLSFGRFPHSWGKATTLGHPPLTSLRSFAPPCAQRRGRTVPPSLSARGLGDAFITASLAQGGRFLAVLPFRRCYLEHANFRLGTPGVAGGDP